jgi:formimidoylglutamate deiminase
MIISADKIVIGGRCHQGLGIRVDSSGRIASVAPVSELEGAKEPREHLAGKVLLPGMVNAHSHAFQRLLRGRTHIAGPIQDNFWTWRKLMYQVANTLSPESISVASRQVFLEMLLSGVTTVG